MAESWYWPAGSKKALRSPSNREKCVCMPEPNSSGKGLGMKVARQPSLSATSSTTARKVMMLSAMDRASAKRRSISFWPGPPSWWENCTEIPICSSMRMAWRRKS